MGRYGIKCRIVALWYGARSRFLLVHSALSDAVEEGTSSNLISQSRSYSFATKSMMLGPQRDCRCCTNETKRYSKKAGRGSTLLEGK